jgi:hypothetical protein
LVLNLPRAERLKENKKYNSLLQYASSILKLQIKRLAHKKWGKFTFNTTPLQKKLVDIQETLALYFLQ